MKVAPVIGAAPCQRDDVIDVLPAGQLDAAISAAPLLSGQDFAEVCGGVAPGHTCSSGATIGLMGKVNRRGRRPLLAVQIPTPLGVVPLPLGVLNRHCFRVPFAPTTGLCARCFGIFGCPLPIIRKLFGAVLSIPAGVEITDAVDT